MKYQKQASADKKLSTNRLTAQIKEKPSSRTFCFFYKDPHLTLSVVASDTQAPRKAVAHLLDRLLMFIDDAGRRNQDSFVCKRHEDASCPMGNRAMTDPGAISRCVLRQPFLVLQIRDPLPNEVKAHATARLCFNRLSKKGKEYPAGLQRVQERGGNKKTPNS